MTRKVLVKFSSGWADEFQAEGFMVMDFDEWKQALDKLENHNEPIEWGFGTNEGFEWRNGEELLNHLKVEEITEEEAEVIEKLFFKGLKFSFMKVHGQCPTLTRDELDELLENEPGGFY